MEADGDFIQFYHSHILEQHADEIAESILMYQKYVDPYGVVVSNRGGWQSRSASTAIGFNPSATLLPFQTQWAQHFSEYLDNIKEDYDRWYFSETVPDMPESEILESMYNDGLIDQYGRVNPNDVSKTAWLNINWQDDFNHTHDHILEGDTNRKHTYIPDVAGVFFVTDSYKEFYYYHDGKKIHPPMKSGDIVLFSRYLPHGVEPHKITKPRISIAIDIVYV